MPSHYYPPLFSPAPRLPNMVFAAEILLTQGIPLSLLCAVIGLVAAGWLIRGILAASPGNERMRQIAGAIEEGAKAYLRRQMMTISGIAAVIFVLLLVFKDHYLRDGATSLGFVVGAVCSLAAGFIGMRVAVLANMRTAQAATVRTGIARCRRPSTAAR